MRDRAAEKFGINATPTFFINGERYSGEIPEADLDRSDREVEVVKAEGARLRRASPEARGPIPLLDREPRGSLSDHSDFSAATSPAPSASQTRCASVRAPTLDLI